MLGNPEASSGGVVADGPGTPLPEASPCTTMCAGQCVNLNTDSKNCGACGQPCGTGVACLGGTCACPASKSICNNKCVDTLSDPSNCGFCGHNCQSTICTTGLCPTTAIGSSDTGQLIADMAIDSTTVYWSWKTPQVGSPLPLTGVSFKPFAGGTKVNENLSSGGNIQGIVADSVNLYVAEVYFGSVSSVLLQSGFSVSTDYQPPVPTDAGPSTSEPIDVAVDAQNVYWVDFTAGTVNQAAIQPAGHAGGPVTTLASNRDHPIAITIKPGSPYVYWLDQGTTQPGTGSVNAVPIGQANGAVIQLATGQDRPRDIATDGTNVYWTSLSNTGSVSKISVATGPVAGGPVTVLAQNQGGPWALVVDHPTADAGSTATFVYWTNYNDNNIVKVPTTNSAPSTPYVLASQQNNPVAIAVDDKAVYWANYGDGTLWKVAK